jgi:purine catabolism regulator
MEYLTVRELIYEAGLGLVLLTGEPGLDKAIEGIHLSDLEDPTPWMTSGMVLVTTGHAFAASPEAGLQLLDRLEACGAVALGIGVGHYVERVPDAMLARAHVLRIPIFESPLAVPFRTIVKYVYNALASSDMHSLKRSIAVQTQLLDLLIEGRGVSDLVTRLSAVLHIPIVLFDARGNIIAPTLDAQAQGVARRLWEEYSRVDRTIGPVGVLESARERLYYQKVQAHGKVERILAATAPQGSASELIDTSLSFAQRLLALALVRPQEQLLAGRRIRSLLLEDFLAERGTSRELLQRLQEQDIDLERTWRLLFVEIEPWPEGNERVGGETGMFAFESGLLDTIDEVLNLRSLSYLSMLQGATIVILVVVGELSIDELRQTLGGLRRQLEAFSGSHAALGCSAPAAGLVRVRAAVNQGTEALQLARTQPGGGPRLFEDLPRALRFLNGQDPDVMVDLYNRLVVPLALHDAQHHTSLLPTLRALCDNRLSAHETAETLLIHRNTLHKRLRRIESVLGVDLDSMDDVLELHIALRIGDLHPDLIAIESPGNGVRLRTETP